MVVSFHAGVRHGLLFPEGWIIKTGNEPLRYGKHKNNSDNYISDYNAPTVEW